MSHLNIDGERENNIIECDSSIEIPFRIVFVFKTKLADCGTEELLITIQHNKCDKYLLTLLLFSFDKSKEILSHSICDLLIILFL